MHTLIVGGTGMLRGVMEQCRRTSSLVSVLGRSKKDLEKLEKRYPGVIRGIAVDYLDETALRTALKASTDAHGRYDCAIVWMEDAPASIALCIAEFVGTPANKGVFLHVRGSVAADPTLPVRSIKDSFVAQTSLVYMEVILGFVREGTTSRWLDHTEITEGILDAFESKKPLSIVGVVEPWGERPLKRG